MLSLTFVNYSHIFILFIYKKSIIYIYIYIYIYIFYSINYFFGKKQNQIIKNASKIIIKLFFNF